MSMVQMKNKKSRSCVLYIGTFPPRECGIATFTKDLITALDKKFNPLLKSEVVAINDNGSSIYNYDNKVSFQVDETNIEDYVSIAKKINERDDIKIINIQHEFGIFGGAYGEYLLQFLDTIKKPVVITFHSVIPNPDEYRKKLVKLIFKKANAVIVMANEAVNIFKEDYGLNTSKIFFVPHGVPQVPLYHKRAKEKTNLHNRIVLSTFGLLNKGKGIEYVIEALPPVVDKFPEILYIVIGETHPQIRKKEGESYRNMLIKRVKELGLSENVRFYNKYLTLKEITDYLSVFNKVIRLREEVIKKYPPIKLNHFLYLTDDTGIIHHAKYSVPNRKTGYTLDDNARALIVAAKHYNLFKSKQDLKLISTYVSFFYHVQKEDGKFHNLLDYDKRCLDEEGSEDSFGRALWACGNVIASKVHNNIKATAKFIFDNASKSVNSINSIRAKAFSIIGLCNYYKEYKHKDIIDKVRALADSLIRSYKANSSQNWKWFEPKLTYSNSKLPEALFLAYLTTKNNEYLTIAEESLDFLSKVLTIDGKLVPIGNKGWYYQGGKREVYDQQPIDASSMVQTCLLAYKVTKKKVYCSNAVLAFNWFLGKNSLNQMMYDETTGGCFDGLCVNSINLNQGAESTISYLLARLSLEETKD